MLVALVVSPLSLRALNRLVLPEVPSEGYLPALEMRVHHQPFRSDTVAELQYGDPRWVFIGDSMLGTRIDPTHLGSLSTTHDETVAFLYHAATGPAWWYLAFKNQLVASGSRPRAVFFFFRDTNLTDTFFRLESLYGNVLDWVALEREPELDTVVAARRRGLWRRAHAWITKTYQLDVASAWMSPLVRRWYLTWRYPNPVGRATFEAETEATFGIEHLRHDAGADISTADAADFARDLPTSVLPLIMNLAAAHDIRVCFVRVQRRPEGRRPPAESPALKRYVADLRVWLEARGALFHDDTGDPEMTLDLYRDGDHIADRRRYTEMFRRRMDPLFR
ncbi:MAG: hypothetical protein LC791_16875 [Acidobacteria bacterium]|nr:hypothetical protein [Acidobacteriota bacterium]